MPIWLCLVIAVLFAMKAQASEPAAVVDTCVTEAISATPVLPQTSWAGLGCKRVISVRSALGEYEPASVVVRSDATRMLNVRMSALASGESTLEAKSVDIRYVKNWYQSESAWRGIRQKSKHAVLVPELLVKDPELIRVDAHNRKNFLRVGRADRVSYTEVSSKENSGVLVQPSNEQLAVNDAKVLQPLRLEENTNQQIWITFKVSADARPGNYRGDLIIEAEEGGEVRLPVSLSVSPYHLQAPKLIYSLYYRGILAGDDVGSISSERKSAQQMLNDFLNMKAHGISNPTIYQPYGDINGFERVMALREEAGFDNKELYLLGITTGNYSDQGDVQERLRGFEKIRKVSKKYGVESLYVYGIDEADPDKITGQYPLWKKIHQKGGRVFAAAWRPSREELLGGEVDLLVNGIGHNQAVNQTFADKGTRVYLYNRPQVGVENPAVYRDNYGLGLWRSGFQGAMNYAYQHSFGMIWNDFDHHEFRDHVFAYPGVEEPIDTIAWEGFREAVDDVRYVATLEASIEGCRDQKPQQTAVAQRYLDRLNNDHGVSAAEARAMMDSLIVSLCCSDACAQAM